MDGQITEMPRLETVRAAKPLAGRKILIIVENLPLPFDRRVWHESRTLTAAGAQVAVICPTGKGYEKTYEEIDGVHIYRHPLPLDAAAPPGYLLEYAPRCSTRRGWRGRSCASTASTRSRAATWPDLLFLIAWQFRLLGKRYIFDHHDINPELYEAKFNRRGFGS